MKSKDTIRMAVAASAALLSCTAAVAAPQLKTQAEVIVKGELKAKVLAGAKGVPPPTPQSRRYTMTRGGVSKEVKFYVPEDLWRRRAFAGEWRDRKGNVMRLARVRSLVPSFEFEAWYEEEIEKGLDELEKSFAGDEASLAEWRRLWGGKGVGRFVSVPRAGARYWVEFEFAESVRDADAQKLLKAFEKSLSASASGGGTSSMEWKRNDSDMYTFWDDLKETRDRDGKGMSVKAIMRFMDAMRALYAKYVPPQNPVGKCTVRVFRTLEGYRRYLSDTGTGMEWSCGLWDPSREELLVAAEDRGQMFRTMRHEAFHQYLFYATGNNGRHAMWFNEGHACFFESVNSKANPTLVTDEGDRAEWVARHPEEVAAAITKVIRLSHEQFYGGSRSAVALNYATSWAVVYFLEKGAYASEEFAPYRGICAKYLKLTESGMDPDEASREAWKLVKGRNVAADFLRCWTKMRKRALAAR